VGGLDQFAELLRQLGEAFIPVGISVEFGSAQVRKLSLTVEQFALLIKKAAHLRAYLSHSTLIHAKMVPYLEPRICSQLTRLVVGKGAPAGCPGDFIRHLLAVWFVVEGERLYLLQCRVRTRSGTRMCSTTVDSD